VTLYEHANVEFPPGVERTMRWVLISPALHRIHHSLEETAQQRNFGDTFVIWDRIFGTYADERLAHDVGIGLKEVSMENSMRFRHVLGAPFER
jgi:sterol desaturase/sphingolipid hydroxylase (fatty acid hydroxylase superfamily)